MKKLFNHLILIFLIAPLLSGCFKKQSPTEEVKGRRGGPVSVEVLVLQTKSLKNEIQATGSILANEKVELKPEISGRITGIYFTEGSNVEKGKLLLKINDADLQAQLAKNSAQIKLISDDEARNRKLLEIKAISQEEYDNTANQVQVLLADKALINAQIAKTEIYAPFSGKIGLRTVSPGNYVASNTVIASLQQLNPVKIEFDIPEKYSNLIKPGQTVEFTIENSEKVYSAKVYASESGITPETRNLKVRALTSNQGMELIPGTFARVYLVMETFDNAICVPSESILTEMDGKNVFVYQNGIARLTLVKTGIRTETEVQITEGLQPGDSLIVSGLMQISKDSQVSVKKPRSGSAQIPKS
jgi:membrane fusion protein (multidrug efflux system)